METVPGPNRTALEASYDWSHFVALSGEEGRRWAEGYRSGTPFTLRQTMNQGLSLLRHRQMKEGRELLERTGQEILTLDTAHPATVRVLERWYFGALAYLHYCDEDFDAAEHCLATAHQIVEEVISGYTYLLPMADHCSDFRFQRIRIARNRRRWEEMRQHVEVARGMIAGRTPYCVLDDGSAVTLDSLRRFFGSIPMLSDEDRKALLAILDVEQRLRMFDRFIESIYILPGFVIPYP